MIYDVFVKYRYLLNLLIKRDLSKMYKRSFLGYLWTVLNPLGIMLVLVMVFKNLFKVDIEHFPAYLISAQIIFDFFSVSTSQALAATVGNASLLKKTNVPKSLFVVASVSGKMVNCVFSLAALFFVMLFTGVPFTPYLLLIPIVLVQIYLFALGVSLFLSQLYIFFRDIQYLYSVLITAWLYISAVFYPVEDLTGVAKVFITQINPLYYYIYQFRCLVLYQKIPEGIYIVGGIGFAVLSIIIGKYYFDKSSNKFMLYI